MIVTTILGWLYIAIAVIYAGASLVTCLPKHISDYMEKSDGSINREIIARFAVKIGAWALYGVGFLILLGKLIIGTFVGLDVAIWLFAPLGIYWGMDLLVLLIRFIPRSSSDWLDLVK